MLARPLQIERQTPTKANNKENDMGWTISVGKAGMKNRITSVQALNIVVDVQGTATRIEVYDENDEALADVASIPARQAQWVWQNVLSTLVGA